MTQKEIIYDLMMGYYDLTVFCPSEAAFVENETLPHKAVGELFLAAYAARERLALRLNTDIDDADLIMLIESYEKMAKLLSLKMYDYALALSK